jgi:competence protein ComFC
MEGFKADIKAVWRVVLDILFPSFCLGCGKEGCFLCPVCLEKIPLQEEQVCPYCYSFSQGGSVCRACRGDSGDGLCIETGDTGSLDALLSASVYTEKSLMAAAIHAIKYDFVRDLAVPLSRILAKTVIAHGLKEYVLCPVPLHKKRQNWRGFNQSELLTDETARFSGLYARNLLERTSFSTPQMELKKEERSKNVFKAFRCSETVCPPKILLVDDVATTLSTLNECAKALKAAGAVEVRGIVLARAY